MILFHVYEALLEQFAFRKLLFGKYLAWRTLAHKELGFVTNLQACFASRAWLKST
jgi:hypothetical protein